MPEIPPGLPSENLPIKPVTTREELIPLLVRASELEHELACAYLFAAYSLKNDVSEGALTEEQAQMVRGWRRRLSAGAVNRMLHLAQLSGLLTAVGDRPRFTRPRFSALAPADPARVGLLLEPFSQETIERLLAYERFDALIVSQEQQERQDGERADSTSHLASGSTTVRDLYDKITTGFHTIPAEELLIGSQETWSNPLLHNLDDRLIAVTDQASALVALARITGGDKQAASSDAHLPSCETIRTEYASAVADAERSNISFEPVRPVAKNPRTRFHDQAVESTLIVAPLTREVADLFNNAYDTMLLMLSHFFTPPEGADLEHLAPAVLRLMASVIRPLSEALTRMPLDVASSSGKCAGPPFADGGDVPELMDHASLLTSLEEQLWQMAKAATALIGTPHVPAEILEATAALQDLACRFAPVDRPQSVAAKIAELKEMQAGLDRAIKVVVNGPYLAINVEILKTWLGEPIPTLPVMALCRCGQSASKPLCDGTHARIDFTGLKDPNRVPDRRDTYVGTAVTVFDNRGICAHSGFCTDRLSTVFHAGQEPFVSPNGARMDDIIRAVRACPSGALSYAIGGVEARSQVDQERPPAIEVSKDGPYRITGSIPLQDDSGNPVLRNTGVSLEHYSLCRCGHSQNKPFCSGMHWYVDFHDPQLSPDYEQTLFQWAGGFPALLRMTQLFYNKYVPQDPLLHSLFAGMAPDHPQRVASWLSEVFGGPKFYSEQYGGYPRMLSQHIGKGITEEHRSHWASLLVQAANEAGLPNDPEFRAAFASYIEWGSRLAVENSTVGAHPPPHMPMPRWDWGTAGPPGLRVSAIGPEPEKEEEVALPAADEELHYTQHIKPLFRPRDRESMKWAFDLWSYQDVVKHANGILQRLQQGSMPCDGAWSPEKVAVFQKWVESSMQE